MLSRRSIGLAALTLIALLVLLPQSALAWFGVILGPAPANVEPGGSASASAQIIRDTDCEDLSFTLEQIGGPSWVLHPTHPTGPIGLSAIPPAGTPFGEYTVTYRLTGTSSNCGTTSKEFTWTVTVC